jgi:hypothetical protein
MESSSAVYSPAFVNTRAGDSCRQNSRSQRRSAIFSLCHFLYIYRNAAGAEVFVHRLVGLPEEQSDQDDAHRARKVAVQTV